MVLFAQGAGIGAGLLIICELAVAAPLGLLIAGMMVACPERAARPGWWAAFGCQAQAVGVALLLPQVPFGRWFYDWFDTLWLASMGLVLAGPLAVAVWPGYGGPSRPPTPGAGRA